MDSRSDAAEIKRVKEKAIEILDKYYASALEEALRKLAGEKTGICFCMPDDDVRKLLPLMACSSSYLPGGFEFMGDDTLYLIFPDGKVSTAHWDDICGLFDIGTRMVDAADLKQMSIPYSDGKPDMLEKIYERFAGGEFVTEEDIFAQLVV